MRKRQINNIIFLAILLLICTGCQKQESIMKEEFVSENIMKIEEYNNVEGGTVEDIFVTEASGEDDIGLDMDKELKDNIEESENEKRNIGEDTSETGGHETENIYYAIYPSTIIETDPIDKPEQFYIWEKEINITFPQIYYSNEYEAYKRTVETSVNHDLFLQSIGNDDKFLFGRDIRELRGCVTDYEIAKADNELISIKYIEECWDIFHAHTIYWGITIDVETGKKVALSEIITLEDNLAEQIENGKIECIPLGYEWEDIKYSVEAFSDLYQQGVEDSYSCYYLEKDAVNLLVPLMQGNAAYVILKIPLN